MSVPVAPTPPRMIDMNGVDFIVYIVMVVQQDLKLNGCWHPHNIQFPKTGMIH